MPTLYESTTQGDVSFLLAKGWNVDEINKFIPLLDNLTDKQLLELHALCNIKMFSENEHIDREQAIYVLINHTDTIKNILLSAIASL